MSEQQRETVRQPLIKAEYEPVSSSHKLNLLLQRSARYSYRQRCCNCCPTILCELLFPLILIALLVLGRYGINRLAEVANESGQNVGPLNQRPCSRDLNTPPTSSNHIFTKCFKFPPRFQSGDWGSFSPDNVSNKTNFVFEPVRTDINELLPLATKRLIAMNCTNTEVR
jgi:hypothetical protein